MKKKLPIKIIALVFVVSTICCFLFATFASAEDVAAQASAQPARVITATNADPVTATDIDVVTGTDIEVVTATDVEVVTATDIRVATATATPIASPDGPDPVQPEIDHPFGYCFVVLFQKIVNFFSRIIHLFV